MNGYVLALLALLIGVMGQRELRGLRFPLEIVIGVFAFYASIGLATPFGLWRGAKWGWWMAAFYYTWGVLGSVADLILPLFQAQDGYFQYAIAVAPKTAVLFGVHGLILAYLFKQNVRRFFRITTLPVVNALVPLAIAAILLMTGTFAAMKLLGVES